MQLFLHRNRGLIPGLTTLLLLIFGPSCMAHSGSFSFPDLAVLAGCWIDEQGNSVEIWLPPENNLMLGTAQTVKDGEIVFFERLQIKKTAAGDIQYIAKPSNQSMAVFTLSSASNGRLVFSNPQHDFPTEIIYQLPSGDSLQASIAGVSDGQRREIGFNKSRISCDRLFMPGDE